MKDPVASVLLALLRGEMPARKAQVDPDLLLRLILYHRVHPAVGATLSKQSSALPPWATALEGKLQETCLLEKRTWQAKEAQARRIAEAFAQRKIDGLFIKGFALAKGIYPDPKDRAFGDIDIWVAPDEFKSASDSLTTLGFQAQLLRRWSENIEQTFVQKIDKPSGDPPIEIDLHWAFSGRMGLQRFASFDFPAIRERATNIETGMLLPSIEDELIIEGCHLARSSFCPLSAYMDLKHLVAKNPDWPVVWKRAESAGVCASLRAGLELSSALLDYRLPEGARIPAPWPRWQRMLLQPVIAPEKITRLNFQDGFEGRILTKFFCQDTLARVLLTGACIPLDLARRLAKGLLHGSTSPQ